MKRYWFKVYVKDIQSKVRMQMPDWLFRRLIEFEAFAAEHGEEGLLPPVEDMAWDLRLDETKLSDALTALSQVGEVEETPRGWRLTHFEERQAKVPDAERKRESRLRHEDVTKGDKDVTEVVTSESLLSSSLNSFSEGEGTGEGETLRIPETMREAAEHPDIRLFQIVTGGTLEKGHIIGGSFPGEKYYRPIVEVMQHLRKKHGAGLQEYLMPFWVAWSTRKTKDKKPYSKTNPTWLIEWAFQGEIPQANGHEPQGIFTPIPDVESTRKALEEKDKLDALVMQQRLAKGMKK